MGEVNDQKGAVFSGEVRKKKGNAFPLEGVKA